MFKSFLLVLAVLMLLDVSAQRRRVRYAWDYGFGLGMANYLGDIGGKTRSERPFILDMRMSQTRWAMNGFIRYRFNDLIAVRAGLAYGRIQGDDKLTIYRPRRGRNLNFKNDMLELSARADIYIYSENDVGSTGRFRWDFRSYLFAGIGGLLHAPKTDYNGDMVFLRPLETEGVRYKRIVLTMPVGLGIYFTQKRKYRFGFEFGWHFSFTDYLDDVSTTYADPNSLGSQTAIDLANRRPELGNDPSVPAPIYYESGQMRGDPNDRDSFFFMMFTYSYVWKGRNTFYTQTYGYLFNRGKKHRVVRVKF